MEVIACEICGSKESKPRLTQDQWTIVRCAGCGLVFLNPRPEPDVVERDYDWFRHAPLQVGARRSKETTIRRVLRRTRGKGLLRRKRRQDVVMDRVREFIPGGRFLDVGCGDGFMVEAAAEAGFEAVGLDISDVAVDHARGLGRNVEKGTIHDAPFPANHFDAVLLMSYLEHEHYPARALTRIRELLRPGGHVFIKVPHYGSWNRMFMGRAWSGYYFPQHLFYFTPETIERLFEKCGLETARNGFWDHVPVSDVLWATARKPV